MAELRKADDELMNINPNYQDAPRWAGALASSREL
jgi:hypothetical protein